MKKSKKQIAIFASGSGTNAERIMSHFRHHDLAEVSIVLSNKAGAGVLERAHRFGVPTLVFDRETFTSTDKVLLLLKDRGTDLIILAGFLLLVPLSIIRAFPGRIVNIHPALLPKYGGKGMFGMHVHEAVIANGEMESGISIHYVNEVYDEGKIIFQARCRILPQDNAETLAERIHLLEYEHYPSVIEGLVRDLYLQGG